MKFTWVCFVALTWIQNSFCNWQYHVQWNTSFVNENNKKQKEKKTLKHFFSVPFVAFRSEVSTFSLAQLLDLKCLLRIAAAIPIQASLNALQSTMFLQARIVCYYNFVKVTNFDFEGSFGLFHLGWCTYLYFFSTLWLGLSCWLGLYCCPFWLWQLFQDFLQCVLGNINKKLSPHLANFGC